MLLPGAAWLPSWPHAATLPPPVVAQAAPPGASAPPAGAVAPRAGHAHDDGPCAADGGGLATWLALVWLAGAGWSLRGVAAAWNRARWLRRGAWPWTGAGEIPWLTVPVRVSDAVSGPMVVGLRAPCVLLPVGLAERMPAQALHAVLRHELAHIRRGDLWMLLLQRVGLALFWWNPLLRRLGARLDLAREMACDEAAANAIGSGHRCADALVASLELRAVAPPATLSTGMHGSRRALARRVEALLAWREAHPRRRRGARAAAAGLLLSVAAVAAVATPRAPTAAFDRARIERLVAAAASGDVGAVERWIARGADVDGRAAGAGASGTALIEAARAGDPAMVDVLLRLGADPDAAALRDGNPLIVASMQGHLPVMRRLVEAGADVNAVVRYDETPLINAAREGHLAAVRYLVEQGADVSLGVWADEDRWRSPLNQAHGEAVAAYLRRHGAVAGPPSPR
nr:M56 family metallopeptidase [Luteimonas sp. Y-2-2-4F]